MAGATVFSWTDEWDVAGWSLQADWGFGLTREDRSPKPALEVVSAWARRPLSGLRERWPRVSVVVCAYDEERTIGECLASLEACDYPDLEVLMCDDGSRDATLAIARRFPFRVLELPHGGLSAARNAGLAAATGEIVAYLDADAYCHPSWPYHLALSLEDPAIDATGGPNLPVPVAGLAERAVAASPGAPLEVLVSHDRAEHVPGCNMAFRRSALVGIGGFDVAYTAAGDDVDVCWKLLDRGRGIGFAPAAQIRHHRRSTVRGYLKQQRGYGRAEKMLSGPHRHRFNRLGQARWGGVIYGGALQRLLRPVVYHGAMGSAPYQGVVRHRGELTFAWVGALLPVAAPLLVLGALLGLFPAARVAGLALAAAALLLPVLYGVMVAAAVVPDRGEPRPLAFRALVAWMHVAQPFVRTWTRLRTEPLPRRMEAPSGWTGERFDWLRRLQRTMEAAGCHVRAGGPHDAWDLEASVGPLLRARVATAVTWAWVPHHRVSWRSSPLAMVGALAALGAGAFSASAAIATVTLLAVASAAELVIVGRRVRRALT